MYPHPPSAVWATAPAPARAAFEALPPARMSEDERDARLERVLEAVELDYLLGRRVQSLIRLQYGPLVSAPGAARCASLSVPGPAEASAVGAWHGSACCLSKR